MSCDIVFVAPNNSIDVYQDLVKLDLTAVEPPTWALLLAEAMRSRGFSVRVIDSLAEKLSDDELVDRINELAPRYVCFVVYGQNVNAGTTSMGGASRQASALKLAGINSPIVCIGSHVQALPKATLEVESCFDIVVMNEGVKSLESLLLRARANDDALSTVPGIMFRDSKGQVSPSVPNPIAISQELIDIDLPGYAWDLLPYKNRPFDLYRSPLWHADYQQEFRSPYAAIQTSLGCQFKCSFCMINIINKNDNSAVGTASNYAGMRYWSKEFVIRQFKQLMELGVFTIRITDEMFFLNKKRYLPVIDELIELNVNDSLRLWAYARVDTVPNIQILDKIRRAGFRWLALGIESGNNNIRLEISKGKFQEVDVKDVVAHVESAGINVIANYIYGLPGETEQTVKATFDLAVELNTLGWNTYPAIALPGSPIYSKALTDDQPLPVQYEEFSFHSYNCKPQGTDELPAWRILELRDEHFVEYFGRPEFLDKIEDKFGTQAAQTIFHSSRYKLSRLLIDQAKA